MAGHLGRAYTVGEFTRRSSRGDTKYLSKNNYGATEKLTLGEIEEIVDMRDLIESRVEREKRNNRGDKTFNIGLANRIEEIRCKGLLERFVAVESKGRSGKSYEIPIELVEEGKIKKLFKDYVDNIS